MSEYYVSTDYGPMRAFNPKQFRSKLKELQTEIDSLASLMGEDTTDKIDSITNVLSWFRNIPEKTSAEELYQRIDILEHHVPIYRGIVDVTSDEECAQVVEHCNSKVIDGELTYMWIISDSTQVTKGGKVTLSNSWKTLLGKEGECGASIGDLLICFMPGPYEKIFKIISIYEAEAASENYCGNEGLMSIWDKTQVNKIPSLESQIATNTADIEILKSYHETSTDLSMVDIYGDKLSAQSTANCYVVKEAGNYKLPLVYGNAIKNGTANTAAYTNLGTNSYMMDFVNAYGNQITSPYIETDTGKTCAEAQFSIGDADIFKDLSISDGYLYFTVIDVPVTGANGVLSVKDSDGNIMWNWHIWAFPYDLTPVTITNGTGVDCDIMPVYLATTYDDGDSAKRKNWFYQWGRSVPILGPAAYNSTTNATSYGTLNFTTTKNNSGAYQQGILNPTTFWTNSSAPYNWFGNASYYNLWDASCSTTGSSDNTTVKTIYDPSPVGFKVPNGNIFTGFSTSNVIGSFSNGYTFKKNSSDSVGVFFPASGFRFYSSGSVGGVSTNGRVWATAAYSQGSAYRLGFYSGRVTPQDGNYRAYGFSVCCVAEL